MPKDSQPGSVANSPGEPTAEKPQPEALPIDPKMSPQEILGILYGKGKPRMFVSCAMMVAACADIMVKWMEMVFTGRELPKRLPPPPPIDEWLSMYRRHHDLAKAMIGIDADSEAMEDFDSRGIGVLQRLPDMPEDERKEVIDQIPESIQREIIGLMMGAEWPPSLETIRAFVTEHDNDEWSGENAENLAATAEVQFFVRVWLPCWLQYQVYPPKLFHRARSGEIDALEDLIRLDKAVLCDWLIAEHWHAAVNGTDSGRRERLLKAAARRPRHPMTAKKARAYFAGLISQLAIGFHCDVTSTEIRTLFDRIARARGKDLIDTNLPEEPATFEAAIRNKRVWPSIPVPKKFDSKK